MKQLLGVVLILLLGFVVSRRWFGRVKLASHARFLYLTGEEFLILGLVLGPLATNLIDSRTLASLDPFIGLGLGYVGFVFGMQFRWRDLAEVPSRFYGGTALVTLITAALLGAGLYPVLLWGLPDSAPVTPLALALVASGVGTSTSFLFLVDRRTQLGRSEVFRFMRFSSVFDDLFGVALFGLAVCALRAHDLGAGWLDTLLWFALSVGLGAITGIFLLASSRVAKNRNEVLLFTLGTVLLSGGVATYLRLSPVFINTVAGLIFCNVSPKGPRYHELLLRVEQPIYLLLLVLAGALWRLEFRALLPLILAYLGLRLAGKILGSRAAGIAVFGRERQGKGFGLGLASQSEMAVAMMVNLMVVYDIPGVRLGVSAVFVAVLLNDLVSSGYFARHVRSA